MIRASGDVLVRVEAKPGDAALRAVSTLSAAGTRFDLEPLFEVPSPAAGGAGVAGATRIAWHLARPVGAAGESPWDTARAVAAAVGGRAVFAEPDFIQEWPTQPSEAGLGVSGAFQDQTDAGGEAIGPGFAWHLGNEYSDLRAAREEAHQHREVSIRIAHLDVGYDLKHPVFPADRFNAMLSRNVTGDGRGERDIVDQVDRGLLRNPGHGIGTLGILAGNRYKSSIDKYPFDEHLGATRDAIIIGVRVAESVVQIRTSGVARGIEHVARLCLDPETRVHVLSMSMGGVASRAWADAVNAAYDAGVVLVTAAGNNQSTKPFGGVPTTAIVYPARFQRVLAACGIMADGRPYYDLKFWTMQGNWGPDSKRKTALAAYTPNIPWARHSGGVDMNGAGTSCATPQIAAAAALYLQRHARELFSADYREPWRRVEAVRRALLQSAKGGYDREVMEKIGAGVLRAKAALAVSPGSAAALRQTPADKPTFAFFKTLFGVGAANDEQLEVELAQLAQQWEDGPNPFDDLIRKADQGQTLTTKQKKELQEHLRNHPAASKALRDALGGGGRTSAAAGGAISTPLPIYGKSTPFVPDRPESRALRGYALDPSFATRLETRSVSETTYQIPWDENLQPGPTDEYIEVVDVDPASGFLYEPVDLQHPNLLASGGLAPSEGTPQFHQQMVYAVARMTIRNFEKALGRVVLWRPGPPPELPPEKTARKAGKNGTSMNGNGAEEKRVNKRDDSVFVQRLRIYPHALRQANAYYSPNKVALLFGYFFSPPVVNGAKVTPQRVFTCLSQDIIAHETTHALLDGMHRQYLNPSNPDVLAFHEAFADIVALLQRLTLPELLQHQIAETRGEIRSRRSLLGQLATQFGQAIGERGGLREAIGRIDHKTGKWVPVEPTGLEYAASLQPHTRGSVLVAAVFDAFMSIYEKRTEDLVRIATEGTGVLRPGALHPDLVNRLADEAAKAASHVLRMCIRALDYCPPTDLTFGEYLRAIITADHDNVRNDDRGYRVAFVEAFVKRGITVPDVRTLSVESLLWRPARDEQRQLSTELLDQLRGLRDAASAHAFNTDRRKIFHWQREVRRDVHRRLKSRFQQKGGELDAEILGLAPDPQQSFEVHAVQFAMRTGPDGQLTSQVILRLLQEHAKEAGGTAFEGGSTVIADLATAQVRYIIRKNVCSEPRQQRQEEAAALAAAAVQNSIYFHFREPFAGLHAHGGH
jgi:hypothetical protein